MIEYKITDQMLITARDMAVDLGRINNSILRGQGNIAGFLGELIAVEHMGGKIDHSYNHDIILDGLLIDVKTKQTSVKPLDTYDCSIAKTSVHQKCDAYAFVRVKNDYSIGWFLGVLTKEEYFDKAIFMKQGDIDPDNNYKVRADCYNIKINQLKEKF